MTTGIVDEDSAIADLCQKIKGGKCVPIVGATAREDTIKGARQIAADWAKDVEFPLADAMDLARVAQYVFHISDSVHKATDLLGARFQELMSQVSEWDPDQDHPLRVLAELPVPIYLTTTYDDLLVRAIRKFRNVEPYVSSCGWPNPRGWEPADPELQSWRPEDPRLVNYKPSDPPLVLHLHGSYLDPPSMVLTEAEHMDFNARLARDTDQSASDASRMLPPIVRTKLSDASWFFVGFNHADRNFRGLLRSLSCTLNTTRSSVAVQLEEIDATQGREEEAHDFIQSYLRELRKGTTSEVGTLSVHWGSARDFMTSLRAGVAT